MGPSHDDLTRAFRHEHHALCELVVRALRQQQSREHVIEAARGRGLQPAPTFLRLRVQYKRSRRALDACKAAGIEWRVIVQAAREVRTAVQSEWMTPVPIFSEAP